MSMTNTAVPVVSVVVATYNRSARLRTLLHALANQTLVGRAAFEVVVVDDHSTDATPETVAALKAQLPIPVMYVRQDRNGGPARARNEGVRRAQAAIVAFTDDDCVPRPPWLEELVTGCQEDGAVGAEGPIVTDAHRGTALTHHISNETPGALFTANVAYRRDALFHAGLFDECFPFPHNEDVDLGLRMSRFGQIVFRPAAVVYHPLVPVPLLANAKRTRYSLSNIRLFLKHPERMPHTPLPHLLWARTVVDLLVSICKDQMGRTPLLARDPVGYAAQFLYNLLRLCHTLYLIPRYRKEEMTQRRLLGLYPRPGSGGAIHDGASR